MASEFWRLWVEMMVICWFSVNFCASDDKRAATPRVFRQGGHPCITESNCLDRYVTD
jgi:hypothetical protein